MFAYYSCVFKIFGQPFSRRLRETANTEFMAMSFVSLFPVAEFGVPDLSLPTRLCVLRDEDQLRADEGFSLPLSLEMKAKVLKRGVPRVNSACERDPVSPLSASTRENEIDWANSKALGRYLYEYSSAMIIAVLGWK